MMKVNTALTGPCSCGAPEGECWSQSGSMGGRPSCERDETVIYRREDWLRLITEKDAEIKQLHEALESAIKVANEAQIEWDQAPAGMRAGKILIALSGHSPGYRKDTDAIHATLSLSATEKE